MSAAAAIQRGVTKKEWLGKKIKKIWRKRKATENCSHMAHLHVATATEAAGKHDHQMPINKRVQFSAADHPAKHAKRNSEGLKVLNS